MDADWGASSPGDDWGVGACACDDWGASDDWGGGSGSGGGGGYPAAGGGDAELDALLRARDARAAAGPAEAQAQPAQRRGSEAHTVPVADDAADVEDAWVGSLEPATSDTWPCLALEVYTEPPAPPKSGEYERELLERYLNSGLAEEDGSGGGGRTGGEAAALPQEMLDELSKEEESFRKDVGEEDEEDDFGVDDGDAETDLAGGAAAEWLQKFQRRIERSPAQVVRYSWGGSPLWLAPPPKELAAGVWPPPCGRCGGARIFELQLLPTLLSQFSWALPEDAPGRKMEWGTVAVYTCGQDCGSEEACEEFVVVQPAL